MRLTLNSLAALRITRAIRLGMIPCDLSRRCGFIAPDPQPRIRWTAKSLASGLGFLGSTSGISDCKQLDVLVSERSQRLQLKCAHNTFRCGSYPSGSFVYLGNGIAMSGPELLFVELANVMDPAVHLLLGMELCGRFSRDAGNPRTGTVRYDIPPATTVKRLRKFAEEAHWIRGAERALSTINRIVENAWSPMEAIAAALIVLPRSELGYDMWPITLNPRKVLDERLAQYSDADSRVPDIMFSGTSVGLNYDGEDHFRLSEIVRAAVAADREPGNAAFSQELESALSEARERIVSDKRRDRDLMALGLTVFSITKEDLEERGGFDRAMGHVIEAIDRNGERNLALQRSALESGLLADARQDFIWSLMPGPQSLEARKRLEYWKQMELSEFVVEFELSNGETRMISVKEL